MKPGNRMMLLEKMREREPKRRSEYGNDPTRRMIGYDRDVPKVPEREWVAPVRMPGSEWEDPRMIGTPTREWKQPPVKMPAPAWGPVPVETPVPNWGHPPAEMYGPGRNRSPAEMYGPGRNRSPAEMYGPGWNRPPAEMYGGPYDGYDGGPEMRRRRDRRGRYMLAGAEPDDEEDDDKYRGKGGKMIAGAVWSEDGDKRRKDWKVDEHKAMEWVGEMRNPNGTTGPHFKPDLAEQLRAAHCPRCDRWEFFVALNMMYADYSEVAKKFGADKPEFYVHMAKAFLEDPDAGEGKLAKYMEYIPE